MIILVIGVAHINMIRFFPNRLQKGIEVLQLVVAMIVKKLQWHLSAHFVCLNGSYQSLDLPIIQDVPNESIPGLMLTGCFRSKITREQTNTRVPLQREKSFQFQNTDLINKQKYVTRFQVLVIESSGSLLSNQQWAKIEQQK